MLHYLRVCLQREIWEETEAPTARQPPSIPSRKRKLICVQTERTEAAVTLIAFSLSDPAQPTTSPCHLVPSSRIRLLATAVAAPLHPALSLAYRLMVLMVPPLEYPMSVSSHLCLGLPLLLAPFILPSIASSSIPPALTTCPK